MYQAQGKRHPGIPVAGVLDGGRTALVDRRQRGSLDPVADENRRLKELVGQQALIIEAQKKLNGVLPRR